MQPSPVYSEYPRKLTTQELELMLFILPEERAGYHAYRQQIQELVVIGEGRRGKGEIILGKENESPNFDEPLTPVFAYGVIETTFGNISVTAREISLEQASIEIVSSKGESIPATFEELRRWTYSTWMPGAPCPQCSTPVRETLIRTDAQEQLTLALCKHDKRIWVYEGHRQIVRLIPVTNFYNELMLNKNIRDPSIALDSRLLFSMLDSYSDADLTHAFKAYNKLKVKIHMQGEIQTSNEIPQGIVSKLKRFFTT
ncbi:MAG: hypothetical protein EPO24_00625 [Bacteroidetes bacterium]|nr:MAG: hypothetical protein EPO24_00625 [Bacteroidota bacterium]